MSIYDDLDFGWSDNPDVSEDFNVFDNNDDQMNPSGIFATMASSDYYEESEDEEEFYRQQRRQKEEFRRDEDFVAEESDNIVSNSTEFAGESIPASEDQIEEQTEFLDFGNKSKTFEQDFSGFSDSEGYESFGDENYLKESYNQKLKDFNDRRFKEARAHSKNLSGIKNRNRNTSANPWRVHQGVWKNGEVPEYEEYRDNAGPYIQEVYGDKNTVKQVSPDEDENGKRIKESISSYIEGSKGHSDIAIRRKCLWIFLGVSYIVGFSLQFITNFKSSLMNISGVGGSLNNTGIEFNIGVLPHQILMNIGLLLTLFSFIVAGVIAFFLMISMKEKQEREQRNEIQYEIASKDVYGSANRATEEELADRTIKGPRNRPEGIPLAITKDGKQSLALKSSPGSNLNIAVFGASGSGKSFTFARSIIQFCIDDMRSMVISDPAGEFYRDFATLAENKGMDIKVLNLKNLFASSGINFFASLRRVYEENPYNVSAAADSLANTIISNATTGPDDVFFGPSEKNLLKALLLYVGISDGFIGEEYERHLGTVYELMAKMADSGMSLTEIERLPDEDPAKKAWVFFKAAEKNKFNFLTGLNAKLAVLADPILQEILSHSEIDLRKPGQKPCLYFVTFSVMNDNYRFILSLFFSCLLEELVDEAEHNPNGMLDVPVHFILDEFKALGTINTFSNKVANVRKYGISISMIFQDPDQIDANYPKEMDTILGNCDTWIVLGVNNQNTAKWLSIRSGEATIVNVSESEPQMRGIGRPNPYMNEIRKSTNYGKRYILTPDEVMRMKRGEVIVILRGKNVYRGTAYRWIDHYYAEFMAAEENIKQIQDFTPLWQENGDLNMDKPKKAMERVVFSENKNSTEDEDGADSDEANEYKEHNENLPKKPSRNAKYEANESQKEKKQKKEKDFWEHNTGSLGNYEY